MRLVTFNILHGRSVTDGVVDPDRLAEAVRLLNPDVLALQEVDRDQPRSHGADLTAVAARAMGAATQRFVPAMSGVPGRDVAAAAADGPAGRAGYGIALLSRYPARSWRVWRLPRIPFPLPDPRFRGAPRRLVTTRDEPRLVLAAQLDTPFGVVTVANTHLSFISGWGRRQLYRITHELGGVAGPVVLLGDLNLAAPLPARITGYRPLASHPTFPSEDPVRQIDHILLRGRLGGTARSGAPESLISDHRPLLVDIAE